MNMIKNITTNSNESFDIINETINPGMILFLMEILTNTNFHDSIKYATTRGDLKNALRFSESIINSNGDFKGSIIPKTTPIIKLENLGTFTKRSINELAFFIFTKFCTGLDIIMTRDAINSENFGICEYEIHKNTIIIKGLDFPDKIYSKLLEICIFDNSFENPGKGLKLTNNGKNWLINILKIIKIYTTIFHIYNQGIISQEDKLDIQISDGTNDEHILPLYFSKRMGLPIKRIITNSKEIGLLLKEGTINKDFWINSDIETILFYLSKADNSIINKLNDDIDSTGTAKIEEELINRFNQIFSIGYQNI